ncbi:MAG: phosphoglucosamine mutase [Litorimonas sp.]
MTRYFGTDGIRGRAGEGKLSEAAVERLATAIGTHYGTGTTAVIGRDTRESGPWIIDALTRGLMAQGVEVVSVGILPTPATAMMVPHLGAQFGLMVTASHNPWSDNGIKLFGAHGGKISDADQDRIEARIARVMAEDPPPAPTPGTDRGEVDGRAVYVDALVEAFRSTGLKSLDGLSVVADCANGAAFRVFPEVLRRLGASLTVIGADPDGRNINAGCGSTHPEALSEAVERTGADVGVALDGDADRLIVVDARGTVVDGDQIIARLATDLRASNALMGDAVVSTVMSNMGLERYLSGLGLRLERSAVGDRHVSARMAEIGANLGGEPSGHILVTDHAPTGDGSLAALMVLASLVRSGVPSDAHLAMFAPFPQKLKNVRYDGPSPLERDDVVAAIEAANAALGETGRVLVRASGTEPVIRVMAEAADAGVVTQTVDELCDLIASAAH